MERRKFLHFLLGGAAVAAAPKFVFDLGAGLYKPEYELVENPEWLDAPYEEVILQGKYPFTILNMDNLGNLSYEELANKTFEGTTSGVKFDHNLKEVPRYIKILK